MTNKLVVIINSLKVSRIKKILLHEIKFLVSNYSCLQNPWLGGYRTQIPVPSVHNWICWTPPSPRTQFLVTPLLCNIQKLLCVPFSFPLPACRYINTLRIRQGWPTSELEENICGRRSPEQFQWYSLTNIIFKYVYRT